VEHGKSMGMNHFSKQYIPVLHCVNGPALGVEFTGPLAPCCILLVPLASWHLHCAGTSHAWQPTPE
jgi:hypothetical protein